MRWIVAFVCLHALAASAFSQDNPPFDEQPVPAQSAPGAPAERARQSSLNGSIAHLSSAEIGLAISVLIFGLLVLVLQMIMTLKLIALKREVQWEDWAFKILGLTIVITSGLFLIVAGYTQDQAAPMMGLLGTVAGYFLGKDPAKGHASAPPPTNQEDPAKGPTSGPVLPTNQEDFAKGIASAPPPTNQEDLAKDPAPAPPPPTKKGVLPRNPKKDA